MRHSARPQQDNTHEGFYAQKGVFPPGFIGPNPPTKNTVGSPRNTKVGFFNFFSHTYAVSVTQWAVPATVEFILFYHYYAISSTQTNTVGSPHNSNSGQSPQQWSLFSFTTATQFFIFFYTVGSPHNAKWVFSFLPRNHDPGLIHPLLSDYAHPIRN